MALCAKRYRCVTLSNCIRVHCIGLLLCSGSALAEPPSDIHELENERARLTTESEQLQEQIRTEQARLEALRRQIEALRQRNSEVDSQLDGLMDKLPTDSPANQPRAESPPEDEHPKL